MKLCTASETISFVKQMEEQLAFLGETIGSRFKGDEALWESYAAENRKYAKQIQMAYQSVITDAIEGCYAFDMESEDYRLDVDLPMNSNYSEALSQLVAGEARILDFYAKATEQSASLLADVPRTFKIVARKRTERLGKIKALGK